MKTTNSIFSILVAAILLLSTNVFAQLTARVQIIHNSADAAAAVVDVWANNDKLIENFEFRTATPFVDVPAQTPITISIAGPGSIRPDENVFQTEVIFEDGGKYIVVAGGIVSPEGYSPDFPFGLSVYPLARESASSPSTADLLVFHGATDAPDVSVWETGVGAGELFAFAYGQFSGYLELPVNDYVLELRDRTGSKTLAAYQAPLAALGLEGKSLTVLASGFMYPDQNSNGPGFGLFVALASGGDLIQLPTYRKPTARLQVIHNSADEALQSVDVWTDGQRVKENFSFRTSTEFTNVAANRPIMVAISENGRSEAIASAEVMLEEGKTYIAIANGMISPRGYTPLQPFNIYVFESARESASADGNTDVLAFHGSTDAPTVSVWETGVGAGELFAFSYGDFAGYLELPANDYILEVRNESGSATVASYAAPLASLGLQGQAISVIASGFLNAAINSGGPEFGLYVSLATGGDLIPLPVVTSDPLARLQVIHNSADAAAEVVDVWAGDVKLIENFTFRTATEFIDVPAETPITLSITGPNSSSPSPNVFQADITFAASGTYVVVANGIVSPTGYEPNIPFNLYIYDMGREEASMATNTDVLVFHGSTDAPTVSIWETGVGAGELFTFSYGEYAGYLDLPTDNYVLEVRDETGSVTVAAYAAPLANLGLDGEAISIVASGFLNPDVNSDGPAFGLWVALASGGELIELPLYTGPKARLQVIHNSADAAAGVVDVWANDVKLIENFTFRTATPFIDVIAETPITISITGPNSTSPTPNVFEADVTFSDFGTYVVVANGIVSGSGYNPAEPFNLYIYDMGREAATSSMNTDLLVYHGSTDAPTVSVWETGVGAGELFTFSYGEFVGYLELPTTDYILEIRDESGTTTVAMFHAPLAALGLSGEAITVVASGFLNPGANSNGPAFGLWVALTSGGDLIELPSTTTGIESIAIRETLAVFPNPARDFVTLNMTLNNPANVNIQVVDLLGKTVSAVDLGWQNSINNYRIDVSNLQRGLYFLRVEAGVESYIEKLIISK